jgi:hypothetical protein
MYYVSPSNEGRHIVLVWFLLPLLPLLLLLLLLSEACPDQCQRKKKEGGKSHDLWSDVLRTKWKIKKRIWNVNFNNSKDFEGEMLSRNRYLSFCWKKWFYIWYMALAWWLVPCLPYPGLQNTNERVRVFLARRSVQHIVVSWIGYDPLTSSFVTMYKKNISKNRIEWLSTNDVKERKQQICGRKSKDLHYSN